MPLLLLSCRASTSRTPPVAMLLLSVVAVSVSRRYPPNVVVRRETVALGANIRQSESSHSTDRRDDPPQEARAFSQDILRNVQAADIIHCHLLTSFPTSFTSPSFLPVFFLKTLPIAMLHCDVGTAHCLGTAICIRTSFDLFQNFFERRFHVAADLAFLLVFPEQRPPEFFWLLPT